MPSLTPSLKRAKLLTIPLEVEEAVAVEVAVEITQEEVEEAVAVELTQEVSMAQEVVAVELTQ